MPLRLDDVNELARCFRQNRRLRPAPLPARLQNCGRSPALSCLQRGGTETREHRSPSFIPGWRSALIGDLRARRAEWSPMLMLRGLLLNKHRAACCAARAAGRHGKPTDRKQPGREHSTRRGDARDSSRDGGVRRVLSSVRIPRRRAHAVMHLRVGHIRDARTGEDEQQPAAFSPKE